MHTIIINVSQALAAEERFWPKVDIKNSDECWNWLGTKTSAGYGQIRVGGVMFQAHRASWIIHNKKEVPYGMSVLHRCDNKECVNPKHLYIGDQGDNVRDTEKRNPMPKEFCIAIYSKLYLEEIQSIRKLKGKFPQTKVASMFGVSHTTIGSIWRSNKFPCKEGYYA